MGACLREIIRSGFPSYLKLLVVPITETGQFPLDYAIFSLIVE